MKILLSKEVDIVKFYMAKTPLIMADLNKITKHLYIVVSPPAFVWDPYMTLTNMTFDPDPCDR